MVGLQTLDLPMEVRILRPQPIEKAPSTYKRVLFVYQEELII